MIGECGFLRCKDREHKRCREVMIGVRSIILSLFLAALPLYSTAATVSGGEGECAIKISGPISSGDLDQFSAFKEDDQSWADTALGVDPVLCLDSVGGSLPEGMAIAQFVYDSKMRTRVESGDVCYSVCAFIFMMGSVNWMPATEIRLIEAGAGLAFHRPDIVLGPVGHTDIELQQAFQVGVESVWSLMRLATQPVYRRNYPAIKGDLLESAIATPASALLHVNLVEQVFSWGIELKGLDMGAPGTRAQMQMACENALSSQGQRPSTIYAGHNRFMTHEVFELRPIDGPSQYQLFSVFGAEPFSPSERNIVNALRYWVLPVSCEVRWNGSELEICGEDPNWNTTIGNCESGFYESFPSYALYHPQTDIHEAARTGRQNLAVRPALCSVSETLTGTQETYRCTHTIDLSERDGRHFLRHSAYVGDSIVSSIEVSAKEYRDESLPDIFLVDGVPSSPVPGRVDCVETASRKRVYCIEALPPEYRDIPRVTNR